MVLSEVRRRVLLTYGGRSIPPCRKQFSTFLRTPALAARVKQPRSRFIPHETTSLLILRPLIGYGSLLWLDGQRRRMNLTSCEDLLSMRMGMADTTNNETILSEVTGKDRSAVIASIMKKAKRILRVFGRVVKLLFTLSPIVFLYPVAALFPSSNNEQSTDGRHTALDDTSAGVTEDWYLRMCLRCVEYSGAAVIKLMQWAGSRPDLFGEDFCNIFSRLQDSTTPHAWRHTEEVLREAYGDDWEDHIRIEKLIGSGCIGQVYKGKVVDRTKNHGKLEQVAVKVMHPNVRNDIDNDLDLMRVAAALAEMLPFGLGEKLKWFNLPGAVEEFSTLLKLQLDFRTEANNLVRFNKNFKREPHVIFPELVPHYDPQPDVLIETYCEGIPILEFTKENSDNQKLLSSLCRIGIQTVCKMIFIDNFVHGDLHPGNIFVSPDGEKMILLDTGMVTEYMEKDHDIIIKILASFINSDGYNAAKYLVDDSDRRLRPRGDAAVNKEEYVRKINDMVEVAHEEGHLMEELGYYISYIFEAAAEHHVMMNQAFVSAALAIKIQEGIVLALDPAMKIPAIAKPIILEGEAWRTLAKAKEWIKEGMPSFFGESKPKLEG